ncbi:hypothetical protein HHK36_028530 [Tetracentron sinense]|uniref:AT-hook motif nuclear-localized protein n=1 Tax=Tetracentron sinense TaxID=13715 RepID=A0A834YBI9_TETSI|nr:hypothetical protein HHK36_028530 [Tetracentron sinense]
MDAREATRLASSEPPAVMVGPNSYSASLSNASMASPNSTGMMQNMRLPFNSMITSVSRPSDSLGSSYNGDGSSGFKPSGFNMGESVKKKRGRPRKYGADGSMALALAPLSSASPGQSATPSSEPAYKKNRGRPPGSGKKQQLDALGSAGTAFTPHVITVKSGEDVASKIMSFSQQGPRTICILSANGAICNVTLRQPATFGGTVTYEGRFEILSLSGSFLLTESGGTRSRTGGLSVSLAGSDGRVLGGGVAGMLMAATPVQVVVGSFIAEGKKPKSDMFKLEPSSAPLPHVVGLGASFATGSPPSQGTLSESSDDNRGSGACNNGSQSLQSMPMYSSIGWGSSHSANLQT